MVKKKTKKQWRDVFSDAQISPLTLPVTRSGAQLSVVFNFRFRAAGAHGGHAPVGEGERDHLAGTGRRKNLGAKYDKARAA